MYRDHLRGFLPGRNKKGKKIWSVMINLLIMSHQRFFRLLAAWHLNHCLVPAADHTCWSWPLFRGCRADRKRDLIKIPFNWTTKFTVQFMWTLAGGKEKKMTRFKFPTFLCSCQLNVTEFCLDQHRTWWIACVCSPEGVHAAELIVVKILRSALSWWH